jgi:hypothetical protein
MAVCWAEPTPERPTDDAYERRLMAEVVSKRTLQSRTLEIGLRERPTTASERVGKGKATPQNLEIYCFDTASAELGPTPNRRVGRR